MKRTFVQFTAPGQIDVLEGEIPSPAADEMLIATRCSAISSGTEMLAYRGQLPGDMALDASIPGMQGQALYPMQYGYALVGSVIASGNSKQTNLVGEKCFVFHPHDSHVLASSQSVVLLPDEIEAEDAVFLANMETAVGLLMDGAPMIGERVLIIGAGVVGLLTTALLAGNPHLSVDVVDLNHRRLLRAQALGAQHVFTPDTLPAEGDYDLVYELSGNPAGMNLALSAAGYAGRVVVGSWYGSKPAPLELGGRFHRSKLSIYASQVSQLDPKFTGRWTKKRRMDVALQCLQTIRPSRFITHTFDVNHAAEAYDLLDKNTEDVLQALITYS